MTFVIGVDVGGTKIEAVLFDGKKVLKQARIATKGKHSYRAALDAIITAIQEVRVPKVKAIGIGLPGVVDNGKFDTCPNIPVLAGKPVAKDISKASRLPVFMENDAKLFALAEARMGAGKGKSNVIGLILGTGTGAGVVANDKILRGARGATGEIGYVPYLEKDYEYYTSGQSLERLYKENTGEERTAAEILSTDHPVVAVYYDHLSRLCSLITAAYNPDVIVIGGGVSKSLNYKLLERETHKYLPQKLAARIVKYKISDSSGSIGAALLALESLKK